MEPVRAKKQLGQHFLKDPAIALRIVEALAHRDLYKQILEIGSGMGILSDHLFKIKDQKIWLLDLDTESIAYLKAKYPDHAGQIIHQDFLRAGLEELADGQTAIIGNFPYNISSQILFRVLDLRHRVPEMVGMFQKEVAERIASGPGNRDYGILSVFMQAFYDIKLLFSLNENDFDPPPRVKSAVLHFLRKEEKPLGCDERRFRIVVKAGFNQRRKTIRNALGVLAGKEILKDMPYMDLRAETLHWQQYVELTNLLEPHLIAAASDSLED